MSARALVAGLFLAFVVARDATAQSPGALEISAQRDADRDGVQATPVASNKTGKGRAQNRRVELKRLN
jgi:hypothetical protein